MCVITPVCRLGCRAAQHQDKELQRPADRRAVYSPGYHHVAGGGLYVCVFVYIVNIQLHCIRTIFGKDCF